MCGGHLGRIGADMARLERALEPAEGPAGQVDQHLRLGLVHRQREAEAADAAPVAERLATSAVPKAIAQSSRL